MYILLNKYFCCTVFKKPDFYFDGLPWKPLHSCVCICDMRIVLLKWNGETLMKWLSEQFWRCCSCVYVLIEMSRTLQCVCAKGKRASLSFIHTEFRSRKSDRNEYKWWFCVRTPLFRWAWAVTEQNDRAELHAVQWWRLRERGSMNTAGRCSAAYIFGWRKFSASQVNGQNDSSRHIILLLEWLGESFQPYMLCRLCLLKTSFIITNCSSPDLWHRWKFWFGPLNVDFENPWFKGWDYSSILRCSFSHS